jgi:chaperonin GroEL (HSP60 family)
MIAENEAEMISSRIKDALQVKKKILKKELLLTKMVLKCNPLRE